MNGLLIIENEVHVQRVDTQTPHRGSHRYEIMCDAINQSMAGTHSVSLSRDGFGVYILIIMAIMMTRSLIRYYLLGGPISSCTNFEDIIDNIGS